jgi:ubiquinone/menaquinone biosynthesis C-methylase UbiE
MKKSVWIAEEELNQIDWVKKYNKACKKWQDKSPDDISLFYSYFTIKEHQKFTEEICKKIGITLKGKGLEIGSGPGILSNSILNIYDDVDKIYLLDMVPEVYNLMTKVAQKNINKLECVIGSFDDLKFKDESLDFVLDFDSIHHSTDFDQTFKEISRVLKPGGVLLCFDRAQPNYISKKQINYMLDIEYTDKYKKENNINLNSKFSRRMNGETEPSLKLWNSTALKYNFDSKIFIFHKKNIRNFIRSLYGLIVPFFIKQILNKGLNITTHYQLILHYFGINYFNDIKVLKLNYIIKSYRSPRAKMIFLFKKIN